ncbi:hypothetical protein B0J12DRAFT_741170 [Macrophomina phaseolina]|uniref:Lysine-specific metallo-endopeptidase domain-containing protein n=1 Tax=Macrophomina phaseolina TaxID=35725 RepID=A0ABQ8GBX3_9PEZI|nr:hypothetical protein B0J12DRAFT_741170 [Macrophomina phaseolina]
MQFLDITFLLLIAQLLQPVLAYKIDATCKDQDAELMRDAIVQAFDMARQSLDALENRRQDVNVKRLIELLFCEEGQDPATIDMTKVMSSFTGILQMEQENPNADTEDTSDEVVIYCDLESRIRKNNEGMWVETSINKVISEPPGHKLSECRATLDFELAFTWNPTRTTWEIHDAAGEVVGYGSRMHAAQINICPWFLEWARGARYKTWKDVRVKTRLAKWVIPLVEKGWWLTPFDATNLLDKVMLHELTHTIAGGETEDVSDGFELDLPFRAAYGWKDAKRLAKMKQGPPRKETERADNNADTLALFGSAIRFLNEDPAKYVQDNGFITETSPNTARNAPSLKLMYPRSTVPVWNPVFEGFLTRIREARAAETHAY